MVVSMVMSMWRLLARRLSSDGSQRGDVPGWVLITLMTAGIVTALWIIAEPRLSGILDGALNIAGDPNN